MMRIRLALLMLGLFGRQTKPAAPPGVVIAHAPAAAKRYIGSPSLAILPDGSYVASHDLFGPATREDHVRVYHSPDRGKSWTQRSEIAGQYWSTLFVHGGNLYLMGTARVNGFAVIRRSTNAGRTWTEPKDRQSGRLWGEGRYHCAPVPVVVHQGRVWRAMEDAMGPNGWGRHFHAFMMSAPVDADLLDADQWTSSNRLLGDPAWLGGQFKGWLEGNAVVGPDGQVFNLLRVASKSPDELAARVRIGADGKTATFDPARDFVAFPGGAKKFTIRFDPATRRYWSLTNYVPHKLRNPDPERTRNTVALIASEDLRQWEVRCILLHHPDRLHHAFQYLDWLPEGDDLIVVSRTAFREPGGDQAHNQHDANYLTFHRFANFRTLTLSDGLMNP